MDKGAAPGRPARRGFAAELFAGVGGFRLGLEGAPTASSDRIRCPGSGWQVAWSNQWEPATKRQFASECYTGWFGAEGHDNRDIRVVLDDYSFGRTDIPPHDLLVGGFPCQDYSVAKTLARSHGLEGQKGALWWQIHRLLVLQKERGRLPRLLFFENVDRLLSSPALQRGRDFAVILASLNDLGYLVEWRVVNAADYGFPQRRKRIFIVGHLRNPGDDELFAPSLWCLKTGTLARAFGAEEFESLLPWDDSEPDVRLGHGELEMIGDSFRSGKTVFRNAGIALGRLCWTRNVRPLRKDAATLETVLVRGRVPSRYYVAPSELDRWRSLKSAKRENRMTADGYEYTFSEGQVAFPDRLDRPARTITTGEGGSSPSRFRHIIRTSAGNWRRLTPVELERLNGFPDDWTASMSDSRRGFMMGNAIVVGLVQMVGRELRKDLEESYG